MARIVIPAACLVAAGIGLAINTAVRPLSLPHVSSNGVLLNGTMITMQAPKLNGYTRDHRAYQLTSESATHDMLDPTRLQMAKIRATLAMQDTSSSELTAQRGSYDSNKDVLLLDGDVTVRNTGGFEARFVRARIEPSRGIMTSDQPVEIRLPDAMLRADALELSGSGDVVLLRGNVVMRIEAPALIAQPAPEAAAE